MDDGSRAAVGYHTVTQQPDDAAHLVASAPVGVDEKPTVLLVKGHDLAFEGLRALLMKIQLDVIWVGEGLREIDVSALRRARRLLVILDLANDALPDLDDVVLFRREFPQARIVALVDGCQQNVGWLRNHICADGILDRNVACDTLIKALNVVMSGYGVFSPLVRTDADAAVPSRGGDIVEARAPSPLGAGLPSTLSERELQVIGCIAEGKSNKVIARRFSISEATVKIHVRGILRKVDVRNRTQAAIWAIHRGFGSSASWMVACLGVA